MLPHESAYGHDPRKLGTYLTLFRTVHNCVSVGEDGRPPAMRLEIASKPLAYEDILWPGEPVPGPKQARCQGRRMALPIQVAGQAGWPKALPWRLTRWAPPSDHHRHHGLAQAGSVAATVGGKAQNTNGTEAAPTLALRGGLCGEFVDFGLLPALLSELNPESDGPAVSRWADLLDEMCFDSRHIDPEGGRKASDIAAEGAWRLAIRIGLVRNGQVTEAGQPVARLACLDAEARQEALAPLLRPGVGSALAGQGGKPILPLLERAAQSLAESTNLWVRVCPALMPIEVGAIVHWACIDFRHAESLVKDIEINRDVAMHRSGPPDSDAPPGANLEKHFERVMEFYMDQPGLGGRVPFSFGEELALVKLIGFCGLMWELLHGLVTRVARKPGKGFPDF